MIHYPVPSELEWKRDWVADGLQYGGSAVKVGEDEYSLFRDHE